MLEPDAVVDAVVAAYRACPDMVTEMDGDQDRMRGYRDSIEKNDVRQAILQLGQPGLLVIYDSDALVRFGGSLARQYRLKLIWRGRKTNKSESPGGASHLRYLLEKAVPTGSTVALRYYTFHASLQPPEPTAAQRLPVLADDSTVVDYWQATLALTEIGDE